MSINDKIDLYLIDWNHMKNALFFSSLLLLTTTTNTVNAQVNTNKGAIEAFNSLDSNKQKEFKQLFLDSYVELLNDKIPNKFDNYTTLTKAYHDNSNLNFEYKINSEGMKILEKNSNAKYFMQEMSIKDVCKKKESQTLWILKVKVNYNYYSDSKKKPVKVHSFTISEKECLEQRA